MQKTVVLNVVGLSQSLLGAEMPFLTGWAAQRQTKPIEAVLPAVTCSVQATYLTGQWPAAHGIVGNGWYFQQECEVKFWRQSNKLVEAPKVWEAARRLDPAFTCANLFWWYNMYSSVDVSVTPRPNYLADGRKIPDVYSHPATWRDALQRTLGPFPLFNFWGPNTSVRSSQWIADAARLTDQRFDPTLTLIYLPHLDYNLQRYGPDDPRVATDLREADAVCRDLIRFYEERGARVVVLSEYGIDAVSRPVHLNRTLRAAGWLAVRTERGRELLDAGASQAFAVADHQVAHVYVNDASVASRVRHTLESTPGVAQVLDRAAQAQHHLDHPRAGDFVVIAEADAWFTYYYWDDDRRAPDFARTVDIHRKPGYDPAELFVDPALRFPKATVASKLLGKKMGFRTLLDLIPLDATLVRGSHGRPPDDPARGAVIIGEDLPEAATVPPTAVHDYLLRTVLPASYAGQSISSKSPGSE